MDQNEYWRQKTGIERGMTKELAYEKFLEWQDGKKTCRRCEGHEYAVFCPLQLICKEAIEYESRREIDIGAGDSTDIRHQKAGISRDEEKFGFDICESI